MPILSVDTSILVFSPTEVAHRLNVTIAVTLKLLYINPFPALGTFLTRYYSTLHPEDI
jgi:hypothetical protein